VQATLFGEPALIAALSQWHTPPWLARKLATWVPRGTRILEPSCGGGALVGALLRAGHAATNIHAIELDVRWADHFSKLYPAVALMCGDFLAAPVDRDAFDVVVMNPPFEDNGHLRFVVRALELAPMVVGIFPSSFEFSQERDRELWSSRGAVTRRARMPARVDFGGTESGKGDTVALLIERRKAPRRHDEVLVVREETWTP
jgi:predicted RNA methylase